MELLAIFGLVVFGIFVLSIWADKDEKERRRRQDLIQQKMFADAMADRKRREAEAELARKKEEEEEAKRKAEQEEARRKAKEEFLNSRPEIANTDEYKKILDEIAGGRQAVFISGQAGTGKTVLTNCLVRELAMNGTNVVVVAPTGVAAIQAGGSTIHSFFRFDHGIMNQKSIKSARDRDVYLHIDVMIVDEISMVNANLMDAINWFLQKHGKQPGKLFGGVQMVFVGDLHQLPPVITREDAITLDEMGYAAPYFFFNAKVMQSVDMAFVELTRIWRQKDQKFIDVLGDIRSGKTEPALQTINGRTGKPSDDCTHLVTTKKCAEWINKDRLARIPKSKKKFTGFFESFITEGFGNGQPKEGALPSPLDLELKEEAMVMFTKNGKNKKWVNGTIGKVAGFDEHGILVTLPGGDTHLVEKECWETFQYRYNKENDELEKVVATRFSQYPLMLSWAMTIHKSQGKTIERIHVNLGNEAFAEGQVYVALSRSRTLEGITLARRIREADIKVNIHVRDYYCKLNDSPATAS